jgi:cardiolipin synthase A/B
VSNFSVGAVGALIMLALIVLLGIVIWSIKRHRDPLLNIEGGSSIEAMMPSLAGLSLSTAVAGNSVELHENGCFFDLLEEEIRAAKKSVHFETFLWKDGTLGKRVAEALADRGRAGLQVRVLVDAVGCKEMSEATEQQLEEAGCKVARFHEHSIRNIGVFSERDHRKLIVIDGDTAFVGGHCIVDDWLGDAEDHEHVADVSVKVQGPIVHSVQSAFSENWTGETGEMLAGEDIFPALEPAGETTGFAAYTKPEGSAPAVKLLHHALICLARERIWIQNPYFIPEPEAIEAFGEAVKRGVDVRVLMPSTSGSDNPMVQHAGHWTFDKLLASGVRLFEYPHTLLHQKALTVDRTLCLVGSSNFDDRSFETNDEITLAFCDRKLAARVDEVFERYVPRCKEIKLEEWRKRSIGHRLKDSLAYLINEVL